ncbi:MAG: family 10 glycosylhydrolase [Pseudobacter sp.]|uniref:family 10 glycosylhydrolase n=1 Tax=Pseudobacter sp. TaxID=2045420 RepID=UPI003F802291
MVNRLLLLITIAAVSLLPACSSSKKSVQSNNVNTETPATPVQREFRAAWVATVANIDWPSKRGLSTAEQQAEAIALLDFLKAHHFNAVVFQVRPQADALYQSSLEPWSYYLTGEQGKAPSPYYDPLQFWTEEAHNRGLEMHVWLNPYRAHHTVGGPVTDSSIVKRKPELVLKLKDGNYWWFDPALQGTKDHSTAVVMDIVKRYDIDGVHFDDYFYPYPDYNKFEDFPDGNSWQAYVNSGGKLSRGDWRREAVNSFIENLYKKIKAEKKNVKFGLSPFGMYRPGQPASAEGFDQYEQLYADAKLWWNKGWVDYFAPQLYWTITRNGLSFPVLLGWWARENQHQRHLWPGMSVGRDTSAANTREIQNQIMITRGMVPDAPGTIHWNISSLRRNPPLAQGIIEGPYKKDALAPTTPWLSNATPEAPAVTYSFAGDSLQVNWKPENAAEDFRFVVYFQHGNRKKDYVILNRNDRSVRIPVTADDKSKSALKAIGVTSVTRMGNESKLIMIPITNIPPLASLKIVPRAEWKAAEPKPFKQQTPVRITIHHEGTRFDSTKDAAQHIKNVQTWGMGTDRNWADIPYHFLIGRDGTIYEGRSVYTTGETATEYDPTGHLLISCLGNLEEQELPAQQLEALEKLIAWACRKYNISPDTIASHKDYSRQTDCPGKNLYIHLQDGSLKTKVLSLLR